MELTAHAYLVKGSSDTIAAVCAMLEAEGIKTTGNPDVLVRDYVSFSMDDARTIRERANLRGMQGGRVFVISAPTIAPDAQNALLKTFEEPVAGARFILIVPSPEMLLPTLRSRMQMLDVPHTTSSGPTRSPVDVVAFLSSAPEKRIDMLKVVLEKDDNDERNLSGVIAFLSALEEVLGRDPTKHATGLCSVYRAKKYIVDRGALLKPLLEQCALLIPKVIY